MSELKVLKNYKSKDFVLGRRIDKIIAFSESLSELGEALIWIQRRSSLFCVDILSSRLHEKALMSDVLTTWYLPEVGSSIAEDENEADCLWLVSERAVVRFDLTKGEYSPIVGIPLSTGFRTNDGKVSPCGRYWFGSMLTSPELKKGQIFSIGKDKDVRVEASGIAIPNTFCWMPDGSVLISESMEQRCRRFMINSDTQTIKCALDFINLSDTSGTPDGGALDVNGNVWIAIWGASKVLCFSPNGEQLYELNLPAPKPSSCCFGGPDNDMLFVTTAKQGQSLEQLQQYPDSGKIFVIRLKVKGAPLYRFKAE